MYCQNCGNQLKEGQDVCLKCGTVVNKKQDNNQNNNSVNIPDAYKPITMWGYFGYQLLFSVPIVGLIAMLVYSFGGNSNINVRNFARSYFCIVIIVFVVAFIIAFVSAGAAAAGVLSN